MSYEFKACMEIISDLGDIVSKLLNEQTEEVYQEVLNKAIRLVPGAQAGSMLVRENDRFKYITAVGYDVKMLKKVSFAVEEAKKWVSKGKYRLIVVRNDAKEVDQKFLKDERIDIMRKAGGLDKIKSTLIVPVRIKGELKLVLNLDNFEREDIFDENSVIMARALANLFETILTRIELERQLEDKNLLLEYTVDHDILTGLPNRRLFEEFSEKLFATARETKNL